MVPRFQLYYVPVGSLTEIRVLASDENTSDQESYTHHDYQDSSASDCESSVIPGSSSSSSSGGGGCENSEFPSMIKVNEDTALFQTIARKLVSGLGGNFRAEAIHRNLFSGLTCEARFQSFRLFQRALERKNGGDANVKYAWYGGSKHEIHNILAYGFGQMTQNASGVYLSPADSPFERSVTLLNSVFRK